MQVKIGKIQELINYNHKLEKSIKPTKFKLSKKLKKKLFI